MEGGREGNPGRGRSGQRPQGKKEPGVSVEGTVGARVAEANRGSEGRTSPDHSGLYVPLS